jgi:aryl-alcohol dehydrogenase-like predicted oxidoreductase
MSYVDVLFAHRCDRTGQYSLYSLFLLFHHSLGFHKVPIEEIVRAFNYVIEKGWALYWGTSAWTAQEIEQAHRTSQHSLLATSNAYSVDFELARHCNETQPHPTRH